MKVYVTDTEWAAPGYEAILTHYPYRTQVKRKQGGLLSRLREARAWCTEHFGPSGRHHLIHDFIIDTERTWVGAGRTFYFKDADDALWFRFRWG